MLRSCSTIRRQLRASCHNEALHTHEILIDYKSRFSPAVHSYRLQRVYSVGSDCTGRTSIGGGKEVRRASAQAGMQGAVCTHTCGRECTMSDSCPAHRVRHPPQLIADDRPAKSFQRAPWSRGVMRRRPLRNLEHPGISEVHRRFLRFCTRLGSFQGTVSTGARCFVPTAFPPWPHSLRAAHSGS